MTVSARQNLTKTFTIDYVSDYENHRYQGNFTIKKLSIRDIAALGVRKAQLNGGMYYDSNNPGRGVDEQTDDFNNMIAHLELSIKSSPPWWDLDKINDVNLLGKVFKEVLEFENSFLRRAVERATNNGDGAGSGSGNVQETNPAGGARAVVGQEVQAALEP
jgi:hypothetical protein